MEHGTDYSKIYSLGSRLKSSAGSAMDYVRDSRIARKINENERNQFNALLSASMGIVIGAYFLPVPEIYRALVAFAGSATVPIYLIAQSAKPLVKIMLEERKEKNQAHRESL